MTAYVSGQAGTSAKSVRVKIGPGQAILLGRDAVEESLAVLSRLVHIEAGATWQEDELRMATEAFERVAPGLFRPMYATANEGHPSSSDSALRHQPYSILFTEVRGKSK
jgi:hypothetical protein